VECAVCEYYRARYNWYPEGGHKTFSINEIVSSGYKLVVPICGYCKADITYGEPVSFNYAGMIFHFNAFPLEIFMTDEYDSDEDDDE